MKIGKLKTKVLVVTIAAVVLSVMFSLAASATHTSPTTTVTTIDKTEIYGGGGDGEVSCNWMLLGRCLRNVVACRIVCGPCLIEPTKISCIACVACATIHAADCVRRHCRW